MYALRRFIDPFLHRRNIEALRRLERVVRTKCSGRDRARRAGGLLRPRNERPEGVPDEIVEATGKVGEAFEWIERARGRLYDFHQKIGRASCSRTRSTFWIRRNSEKLADQLREEIIGRNVLDGALDVPDRRGVRRSLLPTRRGCRAAHPRRANRWATSRIRSRAQGTPSLQGSAGDTSPNRPGQLGGAG